MKRSFDSKFNLKCQCTVRCQFEIKSQFLLNKYYCVFTRCEESSHVLFVQADYLIIAGIQLSRTITYCIQTKVTNCHNAM